MKKIAIINLGCPKNLVDSEIMAGTLKKHNHTITQDLNKAEIIVVNTCCFIKDATKESMDTIRELMKSNKKIIVAGCLAQREHEKLSRDFPDLAGLVGTSYYSEIDSVIADVSEGKKVVKISEPEAPLDKKEEREFSDMMPYSYLKIAEGCNHSCSFCIIPKLKGRYKSKPIPLILDEVREMISKGIKEIILIAQDTTHYGTDIGTNLAALMKEIIANIKETNVRFRILYAYPHGITDEILDLINNNPIFIPYLDIPLQHSHHFLLKQMGRPFGQDLGDLVNHIREKVPSIVLRTTFITGFPSEEEEHFLHLRDFIETMEFDHVGVFTYSHEKGTAAHELNDRIKESEKNMRREELMLLQQDIVMKKNEQLKGQEFDLLVERTLPKDGLIIGRTFRDAPEIDCLTYVDIEDKKKLKKIKIGDIIKVRIIDYDGYDTVAELI